MEGTITVAGLGRPFSPGSLYDCRNDNLIPGITLWDRDHLEWHLNEVAQETSNFGVLTSDNIQEKANALDISAELKLSVLSGLISLSGAECFLQDNTSQLSRVTLHYKTTNKLVTLRMNHLDNPTYTQVFDNQDATHVCTGVEYGADAFFVFEKASTNDNTKKKIHGELSAVVKNLSFYLNGQANVNVMDADRYTVDDISCKYIGDTELEKVPTNYEEANTILDTVPEQMKAVFIPKKVHLYPLSEINNSAAKLVCTISEPLIFKIQCITEEYIDVITDCLSLLGIKIVQEINFLQSEMTRLMSTANLALSMLRKSISKVLPTIRGGGTEESALIEIMEKWHQANFSPAKMKDCLKDMKKSTAIISKCKENALKNGILIKFGDEIDDFADIHMVVFKFNGVAFEIDLVTEAYECLQNNDFSDWSYASHKSNFALLKQMQDIFFLFLEYYNENKSHDLKFVISDGSIESKDVLSFVDIYDDGMLDSDGENFDLPGKPLPIKCVPNSQTTNSVEIEITPSQIGKNNVTGYKLIIYEEDKFFRHLNVSIAEEKSFLVTNLNADSKYTFEVQSISKAGHSPVSKLSESVLLEAEKRLALQILQQSTEVQDTNTRLKIFYPDNKPENAPKSSRGNLDVVRVYIGNKTRGNYKKHVTILVVGATGTGKTTLLNSIVNYAYDVRIDDDFRFKIVTQAQDGKESASSRTKTVTAYTLYGTKLKDGNGLPCTLTVIDTPGYGDTDGLSADKNTTKIIKELFEAEPPRGILSLNAVVLVVKSSDTRLTAHQKHNFKSVLALFGKDLAASILIAATFCDAGEAPVKLVLEKSGIACKNFFKFNNSAVFAGRCNDDLENLSQELFWKIVETSFVAFFTKINQMTAVSIQQSAQVLRRREQLEFDVINLHGEVNLGLAHLNKLRDESMVIEKYESAIKANKDFTFTTNEPHVIQKKLSSPGQNTTTCLTCNRLVN